MKNKIAITAMLGVLISGCAGRFAYTPPQEPTTIDNHVVINKSREDVWKSSIPQLGKSFFVINNIDQDSGLINISYSGDPESYINCGQIESYVKNARGERIYRFPAARARQKYETMEQGQLFMIDRGMSLDGRVNLIFEQLTPKSTRVTANTQYVVEKNTTLSSLDGRFSTMSDTISFSSGGSSSFPGNAMGATTCVSNGDLEREILEVILG